jgi:hypothetical protein
LNLLAQAEFPPNKSIRDEEKLMKRIPKTLMAAAILAAFATAQEPSSTYQTPSQQPTNIQPDMPAPPPTVAQPDPSQQPQTPPVNQDVSAPQPTTPVEPATPAEPNDLTPLPDIGPSIKDWAPTPPGEMNPRTGIVEPDWNDIGKGIPDYSQAAKPDFEGYYSQNEEQNDKDIHDVHKYPNKEHRMAHWDRHWDAGWKWSPQDWGDW